MANINKTVTGGSDKRTIELKETTVVVLVAMVLITRRVCHLLSR